MQNSMFYSLEACCTHQVTGTDFYREDTVILRVRCYQCSQRSILYHVQKSRRQSLQFKCVSPCDWLEVAARFGGPRAGAGQALRVASLGCDLGPAGSGGPRAGAGQALRWPHLGVIWGQQFHIQEFSDGPGPSERRF